nr:ubiquitin-protein ligase peroxin 12 [Polyrhizophydium stewartii]
MGDVFRPSLFELAAQGQMRGLLGPAFKYILTVYAQRFPRLLLPAHRRADELFALLMGLVELQYLRDWGVVRTLTLSIDPQILVPLVKTKLDELHERMTRSRTAQMLGGFVPMAPRAHEDADQAAPRRSALESAKRAAVHLFKTLYPLVLGGSSAVQLAFQIAYMFGKTEHYDPWLWLCGLKIKRLSMQDFQNYEKQAAAARDRLRQQMASASGLQIGLLGSRLALTWLLDFVRYALPMGIFFFKFLEWWYSSDYHKRADTQPIPPPPEPIEPHRHGVKLPRNHQICPLCLKSRTNPTMLPTGYVFCYPCVFNYVSEYGRCPVTHVRVDTEALRKIYSM